MSLTDNNGLSAADVAAVTGNNGFWRYGLRRWFFLDHHSVPVRLDG